MISITARDGDARRGLLQLGRVVLETPAFMPVGTNGTVKAVFHEHLRRMGYKLILSNAYHLYLRPGPDIIAALGGLHSFMGWEEGILTDSGGFQIFSLAPLREITEAGVVFRSHIDGSRQELTPEKVVDFQHLLGSDIRMVLDVCSPFGIEEREAEEALRITTAWAERSKTHWAAGPEEGKGALFGIVQGNFFKNLRRRSVEELVGLDFPGYAIGGLSVGEERGMFRDVLHDTASLLPEDKPRYVMGIGTPQYMFEAVSAGVDMFDCVYPTRVARNGSCFTRDGVLNLKNARYRDDSLPMDPECSCRACASHSRAYLRHLFNSGEILAPMLVTRHNLEFFHRILAEVRTAISAGSFQAFKTAFLDRFGREE